MRSCLAILVTLAACKAHDVEAMTAIKTEVCACKTADCADQAMARVGKQPIESTPRIQAIAREMVECVARLQAAERPSTDPDDEDSAEPGAAATKPAAPAPAAPGRTR